MQWHRYDHIEFAAAKPFVVERSAEPARHKMLKMNLARIFEFVNDLANHTAATIRGHRCVEMHRPMCAVRTRKCMADRTFKCLRAFLAKWWDDADRLCFAIIAEV